MLRRAVVLLPFLFGCPDVGPPADTDGATDGGVEADALQMRQLLQNLISNAIKFRRPEVAPLVRVSTGPAIDGHCLLVVEDNGIGFDQKHAQQIFTVFERLHSRADYDGSGVGLAVCRRIAHRHNGEIAAVGSDGAGARFLVVLPLQQEEGEAVY